MSRRTSRRSGDTYKKVTGCLISVICILLIAATIWTMAAYAANTGGATASAADRGEASSAGGAAPAVREAESYIETCPPGSPPSKSCGFRPREEPSMRSGKVGWLPDKTPVEIRCFAVKGSQRDLWYQLRGKRVRWVPADFVKFVGDGVQGVRCSSLPQPTQLRLRT